MASDAHEKLVEEVTNRLAAYGIGEEAAREVIAIIADRTKDATEDMADALDPAENCIETMWAQMHAASALWPPEMTDSDKGYRHWREPPSPPTQAQQMEK